MIKGWRNDPAWVRLMEERKRERESRMVILLNSAYAKKIREAEQRMKRAESSFGAPFKGY